MDMREPPAFDLSKTEQPLSDQDLEAVNGGANMVAGLGGPDTRRGPPRASDRWSQLQLVLPRARAHASPISA
jgi:hypothetical protein